MALETRRIKTSYPCCGGASILTVICSVPTERYQRTCPECQTSYRVIRITQQISIGLVDLLDWRDTKSRAYQQLYGTN